MKKLLKQAAAVVLAAVMITGIVCSTSLEVYAAYSADDFELVLIHDLADIEELTQASVAILDANDFDLDDAQLVGVSTNTSSKGWVYETGIDVALEGMGTTRTNMKAIYWNGSTSQGEITITKSFSMRWEKRARASDGTYLDVEVTVNSCTINNTLGGYPVTVVLQNLGAASGYSNTSYVGALTLQSAYANKSEITDASKSPGTAANITITFYVSGTDYGTVYDGTFLMKFDDINNPDYIARGEEGTSSYTISSDDPYLEAYTFFSGLCSSSLYSYSSDASAALGVELASYKSGVRVYMPNNVRYADDYSAAAYTANVYVLASTSGLTFEDSNSSTITQLFTTTDIEYNGALSLMKEETAGYSTDGALYEVTDVSGDTVGYFIIDDGVGYVASRTKGSYSLSAKYGSRTYYRTSATYMSLSPGTYYVEEVTAPSSGYYALSSDVYTAVVSEFTETKVAASDAMSSYMIDFNKNKPSGASSSVTGTMTSQSATYGTATTLRTNSFKLTGYTFVCWDLSAAGSSDTYADKASVTDLDVVAYGMPVGTVTLYAQWEPITYYVKFNSNGGGGSMSDQEMEYDMAEDLNANEFTRTGYRFSGWNTKEDGTGTGYDDEQEVGNLAAADGAVVTLYAQWEKLTAQLIVHKTDSGTGEAAGPCAYALYTSDGEFIADIEIDDDGYSESLAGLYDGSYYLIETEAAQGHFLSGSKTQFEIDLEDLGGIVEITVEDAALITLPSVGGIGILAVLAASAAAFALAGAAALIKKGQPGKNI